MSKDYRLNIDFSSDWRNILKDRLRKSGFEPSSTDDDISLQFFNLNHRLISNKPRKILFSNEFYCLPKRNDGLQLIIKKIENGLDLTPHLSKDIADLDYQDTLLNDWGIYHLHLGTKLNNGFVNRTGPVLFVRFDDEYAYFINVAMHGKYAETEPWAIQDMVRIIHDNWPQSIKDYLLPEVTGLSRVPSNQDIENSRAAGSFTLLELDKGIVYLQIGMGLTTSRHSLDVVRTSQYYHDLINEYEVFVKDNFIEFIDVAKKDGAIFKEDIHFQLVIKSNEVYAFEVSTNNYFALGPFD